MNDCNEGNNSSASIIQPFIVCSCRRALLGHFEIGAFHSDTDPRKSEQEILEIYRAEHIIYSILHTYCIYDMLFLPCSFWYCRVWIRNRLFFLFIVKFQKSITHPDTRFPPCFVFNKRRAPFLFIYQFSRKVISRHGAQPLLCIAAHVCVVLVSQHVTVNRSDTRLLSILTCQPMFTKTKQPNLVWVSHLKPVSFWRYLIQTRNVLTWTD